MRQQIQNKKFWIVLFLDILLLAAAHFLAYVIRFDGLITAREWSNMQLLLPWLLVLKLPIFFYFGLYRGVWRYTGLTDLINVFKACFLSFWIVIGVVLFIHRFQGFSRGVFILDGLLTFLFIAGLRIGIRLYFQRTVPFSLGFTNHETGNRKKKLLIIGAGDAAEKVLREIHDNHHLPYRIVGLLDDDSSKVGRMIHGTPILGPIEDLVEIVGKNGCQELLIAIPSAGRKQMTRIVELCQATTLPFKTLPGMGELIDGKVSIKAIRDVSYKDLLGRPPVRLDLARIEGVLSGKTILVTGAGGSIGSELCRQILRFNPGRLILFDAGEQNLYQVEMEILHEYGFSNYVPVLGKVQVDNLLEHVFTEYRPEVVFHAAAYKHVPMIEQNPWEAVFNNILASKCLMEAAVRHGAERFILVSTDKAVRPTNVMGASKRVTELLMQTFCTAPVSSEELGVRSKENTDSEKSGVNSEEIEDKKAFTPPHSSLLTPHSSCTRFMAVRFGNVLGSSGSVIPLFRRQIELGGPVTVTDPKMTRYFMSIEEASQLILQACSLSLTEPAENTEVGSPIDQSTDQPVNQASGGEIFILEMGTPVNIDRMARDLIKLCGKEPDTEIEIKYIGLRPGEKLYEELITEGEGIVPTGHEKIMVLRPNGHRAEIRGRKNKESLTEPAENTEVGLKKGPLISQSTDRPVDHLTGLLRRIDELKALAKAHDAAGIRRKLQEIVVDYTPKDSEAIL